MPKASWAPLPFGRRSRPGIAGPGRAFMIPFTFSLVRPGEICLRSVPPFAACSFLAAGIPSRVSGHDYTGEYRDAKGNSCTRAISRYRIRSRNRTSTPTWTADPDVHRATLQVTLFNPRGESAAQQRLDYLFPVASRTRHQGHDRTGRETVNRAPA